MAKRPYYCQCHLRRKVGDSTSEQISHIPEPYCAVGKVLKLRTSAGEWEDGWVVIAVGERQPVALIESHSRDYLKTREVSDV